MCNFITPATTNILGGTQNSFDQSFASQTHEADSSPKQSLWGKLKAKVKRTWDTIMSAAKDIKENVMPIVVGVGAFLSNWATFCNRTRSIDRRWRASAWSL